MVSPTEVSAPSAGRALALIGGALHGFRRLADLEVSGRVMMTFMRGHMAEVGILGAPRAYFATFYNATGREFIQFDDYDFVVHHAVRHQFWHIKEECDLLREGPLGRALTEATGATFPNLTSPTTAGRRPPTAQTWYAEVYQALEEGRLPTPRGARNPMMTPSQCVMRTEAQLDRIWPQFLIWCGETWGRQIVACWEILRGLFALRRWAEGCPEATIRASVEDSRGPLGDALGALERTYREWHELHAGTVDVHDPMYDANVKAMGEWATALTPHLESWGIKDATKDEMYRELATTVLSLRGHAPALALPQFRYWRRPPFVPGCNRIGAPGMPPFEAR